MKKIATLAAALSFLALAACTTTENYNANMSRWLGASDRALVMAYGPPDKQYQLDAHTKVVSYVKKDIVSYGGGGFNGCIGGYSGFGFGSCYGPPPDIHTLSCETVFTITNGKVTNWGHKGNNCRS